VELQSKVFPDMLKNYNNHEWLCERAILAPRNDSVEKINLELLKQLPGTAQLFCSIDTVLNQDQAVDFPVEFLNSLQPPGLPAHNLVLKKGAPIMLLRNLDPPRLCNGTRLIVKSMQPHVLEATIITGNHKGEDVLLPRIPIIPTDLIFEFKRLQFPVKLSFAMSINKAQGQSLKVVGLNLLTPCFSHGQLYVGCSRVGSAQDLYVLSPKPGYTKNIVYEEVLKPFQVWNEALSSNAHVNQPSHAQNLIAQVLEPPQVPIAQMLQSSNAQVSITQVAQSSNLLNESHPSSGSVIRCTTLRNENEDQLVPGPIPAHRTLSNRSLRNLFGVPSPSQGQPESYWLDDSLMDYIEKKCQEQLESPCHASAQAGVAFYVQRGYPPCTRLRVGKCVHSILQSNSHWVMTSVDDGIVTFYDSLGGCSPLARRALDQLYPGLTRRVANVQRQMNSYDCGVYACANAISFTFGLDPQNQNYLFPRRHLCTIVEEEWLSPFPARQRIPQRR
jgi:ATP-dependent DNA helicase PIF1